MKKRCLIIFGTIIILTIQGVNSQQLGRNQNRQRGYPPPARPITGAYIDIVDPYEEANKIQQKCVKEFNLDAFEKEILKNILVKKFENQNAIITKEKDNREAKKNKIVVLEKNFYIELSSILNEEEIEQYKVMDFAETREEKKQRKKKKRKKRKT